MDKVVRIDADHYTYRVHWSPEDGEYVGTVAELPSLSWLAADEPEALTGIRQAATDAVAEMAKNVWGEAMGTWAEDHLEEVEHYERLYTDLQVACTQIQVLCEAARCAVNVGCLARDYEMETCEGRCGGHRTTGWTLDPAKVLAILAGVTNRSEASQAGVEVTAPAAPDSTPAGDEWYCVESGRPVPSATSHRCIEHGSNSMWCEIKTRLAQCEHTTLSSLYKVPMCVECGKAFATEEQA